MGNAFLFESLQTGQQTVASYPFGCSSAGCNNLIFEAVKMQTSLSHSHNDTHSDTHSDSHSADMLMFTR